MKFFCLMRRLSAGASLFSVLLLPALLVGPVQEAQAAVACTVNLAGTSITRAHNAGGTVAANGSSSFTVNCTRNSGAVDATSGDIRLTTSRGLYETGEQLRASRAGGCGTATNCLNYNLYRPGTTQRWSNTAGTESIDLGFVFPGTTSTSHTISVSFDWNIPAPQTVTAGTFTDTVEVRMAYDFVAGINFTNAPRPSFPVSIVTPASCSFATAPGPVAFGSYIAFTAAAGAASTTFRANCTNNLQYTMALDATGGVAAGLRYTLALSATTAMGTGAPQTHTITGSIPAGQAGTCAAATCTQSVPHSVTISY